MWFPLLVSSLESDLQAAEQGSFVFLVINTGDAAVK